MFVTRTKASPSWIVREIQGKKTQQNRSDRVHKSGARSIDFVYWLIAMRVGLTRAHCTDRFKNLRAALWDGNPWPKYSVWLILIILVFYLSFCEEIADSERDLWTKQILINNIDPKSQNHDKLSILVMYWVHRKWNYLPVLVVTAPYSLYPTRIAPTWCFTFWMLADQNSSTTFRYC